MKFASAFLLALFVPALALAGPSFVKASPAVLDFTGTVSSPSAARLDTITTKDNAVTITPSSPIVEVSLDGVTFASAEIKFAPVANDTLVIWVRVVLSSPATLNESVALKDKSGDKASIAVIGEVPLPVEISSFTIRLLKGLNGVELDWTTLSEKDNYGFYVQKQDGAWADLSPLIAGHGTTNARHDYSYKDYSQPFTAKYRVKQVDFDGTAHYTDAVGLTLTEAESLQGRPDAFRLEQPWPNPFNPSTTVTFEIGVPCAVSIEAYDAIGQKVWAGDYGTMPEGRHSIVWDASALSAGHYFLVVSAGSFRGVVKALLLK